MSLMGVYQQVYAHINLYACSYLYVCMFICSCVSAFANCHLCIRKYDMWAHLQFAYI